MSAHARQPAAVPARVDRMGLGVDLDALADLVAERVAELAERERLPRIVDAAGLADYLHVSRDVIYANAERLGAIRLGDGPRSRLRFALDGEQVRAWIARSSGEESHPPDRPQPRGSRTPSRRPLGKRADLLPIRGPVEDRDAT